MLKIYQKYLIKKFIIKFTYISGIFLALTLILGLLEEISFFNNYDEDILYPYYLTILNAPITLFEIFPFIIILSTQFLFYDFFKKDEIDLLKRSGLNNLKIIKLLFFVSILIGIFNILIYYNLASTLKFKYSNIKNNFSNDNKYLAMVTESGIWIKDEIENKKIIIKSNNFNDNYLVDTIINIFDQNYNLIKIIQSKKINIQSKNWIIFQPVITIDNKTTIFEDSINFKSNFDENKIKNLFSNILTLNVLKLINQKKDFEKLGYSSDEIKIHLLKLLTTPFFYGVLTILSSIIMFNYSRGKSILFQIILGIFLSVIIYYISFIFSSLGD
jgi:lipopolysaccharide export system permease protein